MAGVAHPPAHQRLARRRCLLPGSVHRAIRSTTLISASSRTSTSSPPAPARKRTPPPSDGPNLVVRSGFRHRVGGGVHPDPVGPFRSADVSSASPCRRRCSGWRSCTCSSRRSVAFWIGRPLIRLSFRNELTNAAFRYALVRLRDAAEAIGLYRGEGAERGELMTRFAADHRQLPGIRPPRHRVHRLEQIDERDRRPAADWSSRHPGCSTVRSSTATSPSRRARSAASHDSLSFFRSVYDAFAGYRAAIIRLDGLVTANETARELPSLTALPSTDGSLELDDVEVRTPAGTRLIDPLDVRLDRGRVVGDHRRRRAAARPPCCAAWPSCGRSHRARCAARRTTRCSCRSCRTCRLGNLRAAVSYPADAAAFSDNEIRSRPRHGFARPPGRPARRGRRLGEDAVAG